MIRNSSKNRRTPSTVFILLTAYNNGTFGKRLFTTTLISIVAQSFIIKPADYYSLPSISFI